TKGHFHLKTAGTNWLVAMQIIAEHDPALYREVHKYALNEAFSEASKYYHVTTDLSKVPDIDKLSDAELPSVLLQNDARQVIHITYGLILNKKASDGSLEFKDRLYADWRKYAEEYAQKLFEHIGKHLEEVYKGFE
nr:tagaturonate epimerase family protein [Lachnospiraceae bacterium]